MADDAPKALTTKELNEASPRQLESWLEEREIEVPPRATSADFRQLLYDYQGGRGAMTVASTLTTVQGEPVGASATNRLELDEDEEAEAVAHTNLPAAAADPHTVVGKLHRAGVPVDQMGGPKSSRATADAEAVEDDEGKAKSSRSRRRSRTESAAAESKAEAESAARDDDSAKE